MRHDASRTPDPKRAWELVAMMDRLDPPEKAWAAGHPYNAIFRRVAAATISARAGARELARAEIARARQATKADSGLLLDLAYDEAYLWLVLGEREQAARLLNRLLEARPVLRPLLARDPLWAGFRDEAVKSLTTRDP
jgi:hypothetical protein